MAKKKVEKGPTSLHPITQCAVSGCSNKRHRAGRPRKISAEIMFHRFPTNMLSCTTWLKFCENSNFPCQNPNEIDESLAIVRSKDNRTVICSEHFEKSCYKISINGDATTRLINGACPTLKGPLVRDIFGIDISPIKPAGPAPAGLVPSICPFTHIVDDGDEFQYADLETSMAELAEKEASFEESVPNISRQSLSVIIEDDEELEMSLAHDINREINDVQNIAQTSQSCDDSSGVRVNEEGDGCKNGDHCYAGPPKKKIIESSADMKGKTRKKKTCTAPSAEFRNLLHRKLLIKDKLSTLHGSKRKLNYEWARLKKAKAKFESDVFKFKSKEMTKKETKITALGYIKAVLSPVPAEFLASMLENAEKKSRGRRYTKKMKMICLSLYLFDPRAYNNLRRIMGGALPSDELLRIMIESNPVEEGFQDFVFHALKFATQNLDDREKDVILSWDGVYLNPEYSFLSKKGAPETGRIEGVNENNEPIAQAVVFMVRSIYGNFKQPIGYVTKGASLKTDDFKPYVDAAISKVKEAGLRVKVLVCDQASIHQSLYSLGYGVSPTKPFFELDNEKIFCMFDPPHLLKNVPTNMKRHNQVEIGEGRIVSWTDIVDFYELDRRFVAHTAPKLRDRHFSTASYASMKVALAAQVMSRSVSGGIQAYVKTLQLRPEALETAKFCEIFNDLFDSFNSGYQEEELADGEPSEPTTRAPLREPVSDLSGHCAIWEKAKKVLSNMVFLSTDKNGKQRRTRPPFIKGWLLSINAIEMLWQEFKGKGYDSMPTKNVNQDFVENFFSQVRWRNGHPEVKPREFRRVYKFLLHKNLLDPKSHGKNTNCEEDDCVYLFDLLESDLFKKLFSEGKKVEEDDILGGEDDPESDRLVDNRESENCEIACYNLDDQHGTVKLASALARRLMKDCKTCSTLFSSPVRESQHYVIDKTENPDTSYRLTACSASFQILVHDACTKFAQILEESFCSKQLGHLLVTAIKEIECFELLSQCHSHPNNSKKFLDFFIKAMMRKKLREKNALLQDKYSNFKAKNKMVMQATAYQKNPEKGSTTRGRSNEPVASTSRGLFLAGNHDTDPWPFEDEEDEMEVLSETIQSDSGVGESMSSFVHSTPKTSKLRPSNRIFHPAPVAAHPSSENERFSQDDLSSYLADSHSSLLIGTTSGSLNARPKASKVYPSSRKRSLPLNSCNLFENSSSKRSHPSESGSKDNQVGVSNSPIPGPGPPFVFKVPQNCDGTLSHKEMTDNGTPSQQCNNEMTEETQCNNAMTDETQCKTETTDRNTENMDPPTLTINSFKN